MGPWLCSHGNRSTMDKVDVLYQLQWGRGCVATEIYDMRIPAEQLDASMGPWLCSHGNSWRGQDLDSA